MTNILKSKRRKFLFAFVTITLILAICYILKIQVIAMTSDIDKITIIYTVDISTEATGVDSKYLYDRVTIPTVQENNTYTTIINYDEDIVTEKLSDKYVTPYDSQTTYGTKDRIVLEFNGWKLNNSDNIIQPETNLTWEELCNYAEDGIINFSTVWDKVDDRNDFVNFYINYTSVAVDTEGNISSYSPDNYTPSLWASYVGNEELQLEDIADKSDDNSYTVNKRIKSLEGEREDSIYIYSVPKDEYIIEQLKNYADNLYVEGEKIATNQLDTDHYEIRWYVFKRHNLCWHIDGKLVRKEGRIAISKTFTGPKEAIESVTGYSFENNTFGESDYYLEISGGDTTTNLYLSDATSFVKGPTEQDGDIIVYNLTYTWIADVKYGIRYTITEKEYSTDGYYAKTVYNIVDPEMKQSKVLTKGYSAIVIGINNYPIDYIEDIDISKIINLNFTNTYIPTSSPMPETGGCGIYSFYILGISLIECSIIIIFLKNNIKKGK